MPAQRLIAVRPTRTPSASPRVLEKRRQKRAEILQAALRTFRAKGYHTATLDDIAEHVGVRKTALYYYFPDKQSILYECHRESLAELARIMREARAHATATDKLAHVIREHVRMMTDTLAGSPLAFEITALSSERDATVIAGRDRYERQLRGIIEQGIESGEFRAGSSKVAVLVILGAINWIARWYKPGGRLEAPEMGAEFVAHLLGGLAVRAPVPPSPSRTPRPRRTGTRTAGRQSSRMETPA